MIAVLVFLPLRLLRFRVVQNGSHIASVLILRTIGCHYKFIDLGSMMALTKYALDFILILVANT